MRLVFMGTPDFAVPTLQALLDRGHDIAAVYTRAPAAAGRGMPLRPSPVQILAAAHGLPVRTPASLRGDAEAAEFRAFRADVAIIVAYGLILPQPILDAPRSGCLNLHGSLLPRWRGAAPIQRAVMAGDTETGVMAMHMEAGLDTGPVGLVARTEITPDTTAGELHDTLAGLGAPLMVRALDALEAGTLVFTPQGPDGVTYARKIEKAECRIDWSLTAQQIHDHVRGLSPFPGAFFEADFGRGAERIKVLRSRLVRSGETATGGEAPGTVLRLSGRLVVACGSEAIELLKVQRAGKSPAGITDFLNGTSVPPGLRLPLPNR